MRYVLEAELVINKGNRDVLQNSYELQYVVENLENHSSFATFEIEMKDVYMALDPSLQKSKDFFRRTLYRYDWFRCRLDKRYSSVSVDNMQEMQEAWRQIRSLLLRDYRGSSVTDYIAGIDTQMQQKAKIIPLTQYFYFGLLFPLIPPRHHPSWEGHRIVTLSDLEKCEFEETIMLDVVTPPLREYTISGKSRNPERLDLKKFAGTILVPVNTLFPAKATVEVEYIKEGVDISWNFKLTNY